MTDIKSNLKNVISQICEAEKAAGRKEGSVRLVAVSKFHPAQAVVEAYEAGQTLFGENRVQEAKAKFEELRTEHPDFNLDLHIIGSLQRNKVKDAVKIASCIESVDRLELIEEIEKQCAKIGKTIEILFELHTGEESKSGYTDESALEDSIRKIAEGQFPHVVTKGFMTMAPNTDDTELVRESFVRCRETRRKMAEKFPELDFSELSMGMSGDFKIAIEEGATIVRIGTAIFGERDYGDYKEPSK